MSNPNKRMTLPTPTTSASDIKLWDSLMHIELIAAVEREFKITFTFNEVMRFNNVGDMLQVIEKKLTTN